MAATTKEVATEVLPFIRVYKDGSVERLRGSTYVPPSLDPGIGVSSKDKTISQNPNVSARLYLPKLTQPHQKLPILVYFHGSAFCIGSAFSVFDHRYLNSLVSQAQVLAISVEYRLAPEHILPAAYEDCWLALQWITSHSGDNGPDKEAWTVNHGDFDRLYLGGDSAGANIVHNMAMRACVESLHGNVKILGAFLTHPYFWGSKPIGNESSENHEKAVPYLVWGFVYPSAPFGIDNTMVNPMGPRGTSLAGLRCSRLLVCVSEKDEMRDRGALYHDSVKESGWRGELEELFEVKGEDHAFHIANIESEKAKNMIERLACFLIK